MLICGGRCADVADCGPTDHSALLAAIAADLGREFDGAVDPAAVAEVVRAAHRRIAATATVRRHLPVLATRRARALLTEHRDQSRKT